MKKLIILSYITQSLSTQQCTDIKKVYKDSACCGGNGEAFCAVSKSFDFNDIMNKLSSIEELVKNGNGMVPTLPSTVYLDQLCFPNRMPETSQLNQWPPSAEVNMYVNSDGYPGYGGLDMTKSPHVRNKPPYFALCTSAQQMALMITEKCPALGTLGADGFYSTFTRVTKNSFNTLTPFCQNGAKLILFFTVVMQMEYFLAFDMTYIGKSYLNSIFYEEINEFPGGIAVTSMRTQFADIVDEMLPSLSETEKLTLSATVGTFEGHAVVAESAARTTSGFTIPEENRVVMVPYGGKNYPEHYDICLASRRMYDYMVQNPTVFYPELGDSYGEGYNYMLRCGNAGGSILKIQSIILGMEKRAGEDPATCPTPEQVFEIVNPGSVTLKRIGEKYSGVSCLLTNCIASEPSALESFFLMRNDVEYMRSLWVTFLHVHLKAIETYCETPFTAQDPWGDTSLVYNVEQLLNLRTKQEAVYPVVEPDDYISPYKNCTDYGYNNALPPYESDCTLTKPIYPSPQSIDIMSYLKPEEKVCKDDPVHRAHFILGGSATALVSSDLVFAGLKRTVENVVGTPYTDCQICSVPISTLPSYVTGTITYALLFPKTCSTCPGIDVPFC